MIIFVIKKVLKQEQHKKYLQNYFKIFFLGCLWSALFRLYKNVIDSFLIFQIVEASVKVISKAFTYIIFF